MIVPKLSSSYAILDVMRGRKGLAKHLASNGPVRVMIEATITDPYGYDDGDSIEFNMNVHSVTPIAEPPQQPLSGTRKVR